MTTAADLLDEAGLAPAGVGGRCRVIGVDGPAGSGKTTLAEALVSEAGRRGLEVTLVAMDDVYDGWRGVLTVGQQVCALLRSLHTAGSARYRRYDWHRESYGEERTVTLPDVLVLEGVGSCVPACDELLALRVWVEAPREVRLVRGLQRDGSHVREQWLTFMADEEQVHARDRTRERVDVVVDGVTGAVRRQGS